MLVDYRRNGSSPEKTSENDVEGVVGEIAAGTDSGYIGSYQTQHVNVEI